MKERKRHIPLIECDGTELVKANLSVYRYHQIGVVEYVPKAGQGNVEFHWEYLCRNEAGSLVLIIEDYNMPV